MRWETRRGMPQASIGLPPCQMLRQARRLIWKHTCIREGMVQRPAFPPGACFHRTAEFPSAARLDEFAALGGRSCQRKVNDTKVECREALVIVHPVFLRAGCRCERAETCACSLCPGRMTGDIDNSLNDADVDNSFDDAGGIWRADVDQTLDQVPVGSAESAKTPGLRVHVRSRWTHPQPCNERPPRNPFMGWLLWKKGWWLSHWRQHQSTAAVPLGPVPGFSTGAALFYGRIGGEENHRAGMFPEANAHVRANPHDGLMNGATEDIGQSGSGPS